MARAALVFSLAGPRRRPGPARGRLLRGLLPRRRRPRAPRRGTRLILGRFLAVFLTLGLAYFLWRFWYFGYPLPNPFYKKGAGLLYGHSLRQSWRNLFSLGLPFVAVLLLGPFFRATRRVALLTLIPVLAFVCLFVLISDETNYVMRFRYPVLPAILIGCGRGLAGGLRSSARALAPACRGRGRRRDPGGLAFFQHRRFQHVEPRRMGLYDAALVLRDYSRYNYALVTTEAGLLPFYSTWRAVDAWGLNDPFVAHHGGDHRGVPRSLSPRGDPVPRVLLARDPGDRRPRREPLAGPAWYRMVMTLKGYAERNGYVLAAVFGRNAYDTHYYYVRSGFARSREITDRIRALDYQWDGEPTIDFAAPPCRLSPAQGTTSIPWQPETPDTVAQILKNPGATG